MMQVIGVIGKLNSGKNTFADVFVERGGFTPMAFADPIKVILKDLFNLPHEELWGTSDQRTARSRELMQVFGTDFARKYDPLIWVNKMYERIWHCKKYGVDKCFPSKTITHPDRIIVTDIRFPNEAEMLTVEFNAKHFRIWRPDSEVIATTEHTQHASETALDDPSNIAGIVSTIANVGTRDELLSMAVRSLEKLCSP